jgi:NADH-quinone oxidoreductase subunit I
MELDGREAGGHAIIPAMSPAAYFRNIYDNVVSVAVGMRITLKYCFQKGVTVQYPEQRLSFAPRYRGIHEFEADKCIACDLCAKACPVDCIYIDKTGARKIDKATGKAAGGELVRFAIDYSKCLFCALCTEPCPTECIHMGKLHDLSSYSREDVVVEFMELDKKGLRTPIPLWMTKNSPTIPWVRQEYERVKSGTLATRAGDIPPVK